MSNIFIERGEFLEWTRAISSIVEAVKRDGLPFPFMYEENPYKSAHTRLITRPHGLEIIRHVPILIRKPFVPVYPRAPAPLSGRGASHLCVCVQKAASKHFFPRGVSKVIEFTRWLTVIRLQAAGRLYIQYTQ